jgi:hypothetical protein
MFRRRRMINTMRAALDDEQLSTLQQANALAAKGQFGQAAPLFTQLAAGMEGGGHPRRAANLHAQASHAYAESQDEVHALAQAQVALRLFIRWQMAQRTPVFYANITRKMTAKGMAASVAVLQKEFGQAGSEPVVQAAPAPARCGSLPPACTQCGAPVRSDEVAWVDDQTAECIYCGALVKTL